MVAGSSPVGLAIFPNGATSCQLPSIIAQCALGKGVKVASHCGPNQLIGAILCRHLPIKAVFVVTYMVDFRTFP